MLHVPQTFAERIRFREREELGYLLAYDDKGIDVIVTNMTKPTYGSFDRVDSDPFILKTLNRFLSRRTDFTAIPYHTNPIEGVSEGHPSDLSMFAEMEKDGIVYFCVGTPTRVLFFRVFRGHTYPITKYRLITKSSERMRNVSKEIENKLKSAGVDMYPL